VPYRTLFLTSTVGGYLLAGRSIVVSGGRCRFDPTGNKTRTLSPIADDRGAFDCSAATPRRVCGGRLVVDLQARSSCSTVRRRIDRTLVVDRCDQSALGRRLQLRFELVLTAVRPRYDRSTTCVTTEGELYIVGCCTAA